MKIVTRYLAREVYTAMLAAIVVLLFIFLSNQFVRFMHSAAGGMLSGSAIKILLLLQLPILSSVLLPASLFLGILLAYGRLYASKIPKNKLAGKSTADKIGNCSNNNILIALPDSIPPAAECMK